MSHYGPPGGPYGAYPGQPDDPYSGHTYHGQQHGQQRDPYGYDSPSDPWGQGSDDPWADHPTAAQLPAPPPPAGAYGPPEPDWDQADPPPERRGNTLLFIAVGALVLVVAGAVGYALYLLSGEEGEPVATRTETPSPAPSGQTPAPTPTPGSTQDTTGQAAARAQQGDCVVNRGTDDEPEMQIVACDADEDLIMYEVLERIDTAVEGDEPPAQNASAQQACQDIDGYTHHYFEVSELLSFVLCLQEQAQ